MDPKACLEETQAHLDAGDGKNASWQLADYWTWRCKGGFEPVMADGKTGDNFAAELLRRMSYGDHPENEEQPNG